MAPLRAHTYIRHLLSLLTCGVRMAERSKAPDSRADLALSWVFWSTYVGVGSNPTSDTLFLTFFSLLCRILVPLFRSVPVGDTPGMELRLIDDAFVKICDMVNDCSVSVRTEAARFLVRNEIDFSAVGITINTLVSHTHCVPCRVIFTVYL